MSQFYNEMADLALELLENFGTKLTIVRTPDKVVDPVTGEITGDEPDEQEVTALILPASKGTAEAFDTRFINGTLIESNLKALKIPAKSCKWKPEPGNKVLLEGHEWTLIGVTELSPNGIDLIYSGSIQR